MRLTHLTLILSTMLGCADSGQQSSSDGTPSGGKSDGNGFSTSQSAAETTAHASKIAWLLDQTAATAVSCKTQKGDEIVIEKGQNPADDTGLVVSGAFEYGTNEIREAFVSGNLLLEFGEEGNAQLLISNFSWFLFGYDGTSAPSLDDTTPAPGAVINEGETVDPVTCTVVR